MFTVNETKCQRSIYSNLKSKCGRAHVYLNFSIHSVQEENVLRRWFSPLTGKLHPLNVERCAPAKVHCANQEWFSTRQLQHLTERIASEVRHRLKEEQEGVSDPVSSNCCSKEAQFTSAAAADKVGECPRKQRKGNGDRSRRTKIPKCRSSEGENKLGQLKIVSEDNTPTQRQQSKIKALERLIESIALTKCLPQNDSVAVDKSKHDDPGHAFDSITITSSPV